MNGLGLITTPPPAGARFLSFRSTAMSLGMARIARKITCTAGQLADATDDGSCSLTSSNNWSDGGEKGSTTYDVSDASVEEGLQQIVDNSRRRDGQSFKMQGSVFFRMTSMDDVWVSSVVVGV